MGRRKKAENETEEQARERRILDKISNHATRSEKTSWERKQTNLNKIIDEKLNPVEEQILDLAAHKRDMMDDISIRREEMVQSCIHPFDLLILKDDHVECKFCNRRISIPNDGS